MLVPPSTSLTEECILLFGYEGSGKSRCWAELRRWYEITDTAGFFHVLSTERKRAFAVAQGYNNGTPGHNFMSNAMIYEVAAKSGQDRWSQLQEYSEKILENATPNDWLCLDSAGSGWEWAQDAYIEKQFGKDKTEFFAAGGKAKELNYQVINSDYRNWFNGLILEFPGHKLIVAQAEPIRIAEKPGDWGDAKEVLEMYQRHGHRPTGQKHLSYMVHTRLWLKMLGIGRWTFSTLKDSPNREYKDNEPMVDFVSSYLIPCAGWEIR